jgi:ABC-2 type transport system permease protein
VGINPKLLLFCERSEQKAFDLNNYVNLINLKMNNILFLIKLEWLKLRTYTPFLVLMGMYVVLLPLFMSVGLSIKLPEQIGNPQSFYMFPTVWQTLAYVGNWLCYFIMGFIAVLTVTNEFSNRTLRQNIISGVSRLDFYLSKIYFLFLVALGATAYYVIVALIYGFTFTETVYMSKLTENIDMIPRYWLMIATFMSFGFMLGILLRKTGIALFLYFAYVMFIERILRYLVIGKIFGAKDWIVYAPINAANDLTPFPLPKMVTNMTESAEVKLFLSPTQATVTALISTILFLYLAYHQLKTRDL